MSRPAALVVFLVAVLAGASAAVAQQDLAAAKELYTSAKYEEALAVLDRLKEAKPPSPEAALAVGQYRAMCLLALNRKDEAEQAIEAIADLDPFYQPAEDDAAPWVLAAFREARRKVLPAALQRLYGHAKDAYTKKDMAEAVVAFGRVIKILDDPDLALDKAAQGDMKMVAQGFMDLAQAAATAPPAPTAPPASPQPASPSPTAAAGSPATPSPGSKPAAGGARPPDDAPVVYDGSSPDVTPPLPVRREVPTWAFGPRVAVGTEVVVEIVLKENGSVESAVIRQSAGKYYDGLVAQAARNWLYRPALKNGQPVRYRLLVKVVVGRQPAPGGDQHAQ
jgi:TonB family protein